MLFRHNLRKALRFGGAGCVTSGTEHGRIRQNRLDCRWIVGMFGLRPVAGFAIHVRMFAVLLYVQNVHVTGLASLVPGVFGRMRGNLADGSPAIVPILSKALGDNVVAYHQKQQKGEDE